MSRWREPYQRRGILMLCLIVFAISIGLIIEMSTCP